MQPIALQEEETLVPGSHKTCREPQQLGAEPGPQMTSSAYLLRAFVHDQTAGSWVRFLNISLSTSSVSLTEGLLLPVLHEP
jgi:hypothetical protein